jgi:hypothetical protein
MIDLSLPVTIEDGAGHALDLNSLAGQQNLAGGSVPLSGYLVDAFTFGGSNPVGYEESRSTDDGVDATEAYVGRRILNAVVWVYGATRLDLYNRLQVLISAMRFLPNRYIQTDGFRKLQFTMLTPDVTNYPPDGSLPAYCVVRPAQLPAIQVDSSTITGSDELGYASRISLSWLMKHPFKYASSLNSLNVPITNTNTNVANHGAADADPQLLITATGSQTTDIKITITLNGTPLELLVTKTLGTDGSITRSILVDFKDQVVYTREQTGSVISSILSQNLIVINSGATFGQIHPTRDSDDGVTPTIVKVRIQNSSTLTDITTGYAATLSWREAWF